MLNLSLSAHDPGRVKTPACLARVEHLKAIAPPSELNHTLRGWFNPLPGNCIFYIFFLYEFLPSSLDPDLTPAVHRSREPKCSSPTAQPWETSGSVND